jgi:hypothetical protein
LLKDSIQSASSVACAIVMNASTKTASSAPEMSVAVIGDHTALRPYGSGAVTAGIPGTTSVSTLRVEDMAG